MVSEMFEECGRWSLPALFTYRLKTLGYKSKVEWSGCAKVLCNSCHPDVQLILVYSWARSAILVAGKGEEGFFFSSVSSLPFLFLFLPCPSLLSLLLSLISLFSLSLGDDTK